MGFRNLGDQSSILLGYEPRPGLEGPFNFGGRVLYYDQYEGQYWDPRTDFYVSHEEYFQLVGLLT